MQLFAHPFSSYCWKVLIALYENGTPFEYRVLTPEDPATQAEHAALWPLKKMPVLVDGAHTLIETSIIIEHLQLAHPGATPLLPADPRAALEVRMLDRFFDNYVMTPMQKVVLDVLRPETDRDRWGVAEARRMLDAAYAWLEERLGDREYAAASGFGMADCAAAPSLFYADWAHPIADRFPRVRAYRQRLLKRPSVVRAVDEARPFRPYFPLGAPDRD